MFSDGTADRECATGKLVSGRRLQLPVEIRRELSLSGGGTLLIEVVDGEICARPYRVPKSDVF